jgi:SNF2 family DNA or RNA helicase
MYNVWPRQCAAWEDFKHLRVGVAHGKARVQVLKNSELDIVVINPEGLEWLEDHAEYVRANFDILVTDESTKFKNTGSQRFKRLKKLVKHFRRRYILTGSFTPQGLLDLFGQVYILDEGAALGGYIAHYKSKYFYPTDYMGYSLAPHPWAAEEIAKKIAPLTLVLEREGNLVMPELLPCNDILVDIPTAARAKYDTMLRELVAKLDTDEFAVAANAAVATSKCRQIANGFMFTGLREGEWEDVHTEKIDALTDLIDQLSGESLLVIYEFTPDLEKLKKALPGALVLTTGNARKDDQSIAVFAAGLAPVALAQVTSISLGIDGLQNGCSNVCFYSLTWNLEAYSQTIDRVWRSGQKSPVVSVHRLIAKDTVDERVLSVLGNKEATQTDFLALLKSMRDSV